MKTKQTSISEQETKLKDDIAYRYYAALEQWREVSQHSAEKYKQLMQSEGKLICR